MLYILQIKKQPHNKQPKQTNIQKNQNKTKTMRYQLLKRPVRLPDDFDMLAV